MYNYMTCLFHECYWSFLNLLPAEGALEPERLAPPLYRAKAIYDALSPLKHETGDVCVSATDHTFVIIYHRK